MVLAELVDTVDTVEEVVIADILVSAGIKDR